VGLDVDVRVELCDVVAGGLDLRAADVVVAVDDLALEVREFDHVVVDDAEAADARGREVLDDGRAEAAGPHAEHGRVEQVRLSLRPDVVHDDVPGVAVELLRVEVEAHVHRFGITGEKLSRRTDAHDCCPTVSPTRPNQPASARSAAPPERRALCALSCARDVVRGSRERCVVRATRAPRQASGERRVAERSEATD